MPNSETLNSVAPRKRSRTETAFRWSLFALNILIAGICLLYVFTPRPKDVLQEVKASHAEDVARMTAIQEELAALRSEVRTRTADRIYRAEVKAIMEANNLESPDGFE